MTDSPNPKTADIDTGFKDIVFRETASLMGALSDPRRLELLELLIQCERSVEDLAREAGAGISTVSHHLQVLHGRKLVSSRKEGRYVFYRTSAFGMELWTAVTRLAAMELSEIKVAAAELIQLGDSVEPVDYPRLLSQSAAGEVVLLDVRPREEYDAGHVPGAVSIPLEELHERMRNLPGDRPVVAYCRDRYCVLSFEAVRLLKEHGFSVSRTAEGVAEWKSSGYSFEKEVS